MVTGPCGDCGTDGKLVRGYCDRCGTRRRRAGLLHPLTDDDRFWANVRKDPDGCWRWTASGIRDYGRIKYGGKRALAHRVSWEMHRGPIPDGMEVCHNCPGGDDPSCVNPDHLFLGTHAQNMADMGAKGRSGASDRRGEKSGASAKLTDDSVREIRALYAAGGESYYTLGRRYGVTHGTIRFIIIRKTWSHLD